MIYPKNLENIIHFFKKLPGVGEKSAERHALMFLNFSKEDLISFSANLLEGKDNIRKCSVCGHLTDENVCSICQDKSRKQNLICILEDDKSVFSFEKVGSFKGVYHVLNGLISPIDGIRPEDINFSSLEDRINKLKSCELIIALKSTIEGETTTLFLTKMFENNENVVLSRLSYGIPIGAEIDYLDPLSLDRAISDRKTLNDKKVTS